MKTLLLVLFPSRYYILAVSRHCQPWALIHSQPHMLALLIQHL